MKEYEVIWSVRLRKTVKATGQLDAIDKVCDLDPLDGRYVDDTFEIINAEVLDG